ncbi:MAG TPA: hypothetical protein VMJ65_07955 [Solirubrobacteraceae bacterium]|nr:hypothetical protein [Solirubrobacteraceae bacterium]
MSIYCAEVLAEAPDRKAPGESGSPRAAAPPDHTLDVKVLLIGQRPDGFFLERFTPGGEPVGTTRHDEMDEAMREAYSEYGQVSDWRLCPDDADPLEYIRERSS